MDEPNQIEIADWRSGNRVHVFYWELPSPVYAQDEEHGRMTMRRSYRDHCESDLCLGYHTVQQKRLIKERTRSHISNVPHTVTPYLILTLKFLIVLAIDSIVVERNIGVVGIVSLLAGVAIKSSSTATTPDPCYYFHGRDFCHRTDCRTRGNRQRIVFESYVAVCCEDTEGLY